MNSFYITRKHLCKRRLLLYIPYFLLQQLKQMKLAARIYAHYQKADDADMRLGVIVTPKEQPIVVKMLVVE